MTRLRTLLAFLLAGIALPYVGSRMNDFVMDRNAGLMPVLVLNAQMLQYIGPPLDMRHVVWDRHKRYFVLSDIFPLPYFEDGDIHLADEMCSAGDFLIWGGRCFPLIGLYWLFRRRK